MTITTQIVFDVEKSIRGRIDRDLHFVSPHSNQSSRDATNERSQIKIHIRGYIIFYKSTEESCINKCGISACVQSNFLDNKDPETSVHASGVSRAHERAFPREFPAPLSRNGLAKLGH